MRFDPSLGVDLNRCMKIATREMENEVSVYGDNECVIRGKTCEVTNCSGNPSSGLPRDHSSEW